MHIEASQLILHERQGPLHPVNPNPLDDLITILQACRGVVSLTLLTRGVSQFNLRDLGCLAELPQLEVIASGFTSLERVYLEPPRILPAQTLNVFSTPSFRNGTHLHFSLSQQEGPWKWASLSSLSRLSHLAINFRGYHYPLISNTSGERFDALLSTVHLPFAYRSPSLPLNSFVALGCGR